MEQLETTLGIAEFDRQQTESSDGTDPEDLPEIVPEVEGEDDGEEIDSEAARSFRRGLKAECMNLLPTQLMWHRTLAGTAGVQDLATRAWNLSVALLHRRSKAGTRALGCSRFPCGHRRTNRLTRG